MSELAPPPAHVVAAFGVGGASATRLPGKSGTVWRFGDVVLRPAGDPVAAAWVAGVFESLRVAQIRIPRPVRSLDGRWVVGGWCAQRFLSGRPAARYDDSIVVSRYLSSSLRDVPVPRFLERREDLIGWADRLAWEPDADGAARLGDGDGASAWMGLAVQRRPIDSPQQVVHADLFGNVLFAGAAPPGIVDFAPLVRPASYPAAVLVVDAVAWGDSSADLADRAAEGQDWNQLLLRACLFRLALVLTHPRTTALAQQRLLDAVKTLRSRFR